MHLGIWCLSSQIQSRQDEQQIYVILLHQVVSLSLSANAGFMIQTKPLLKSTAD